MCLCCVLYCAVRCVLCVCSIIYVYDVIFCIVIMLFYFLKKNVFIFYNNNLNMIIIIFIVLC